MWIIGAGWTLQFMVTFCCTRNLCWNDHPRNTVCYVYTHILQYILLISYRSCGANNTHPWLPPPLAPSTPGSLHPWLPPPLTHSPSSETPVQGPGSLTLPVTACLWLEHLRILRESCVKGRCLVFLNSDGFSRPSLPRSDGLEKPSLPGSDGLEKPSLPGRDSLDLLSLLVKK